MKILYVGSLYENSNSYRRYKTLGLLSHEMVGVDLDEFIYKNVFTKFHYHLNIGPGISSLNKKILSVAKEKKSDILWIDNKSYLKSNTLKKIRVLSPGIKIITVITDDITGRLKYQWRLSLKNAKYFDCHFVQRSVNVAELKSYGARRVELCYRSFDPEFHRAVILSEEEIKKYKSSVGFIGTWEKEREEFIAYLIRNNIPVNITGDGWPKGKHWEIIKPLYHGPSVYGEAYIKTINGMDIALHFLRHGNRDEQDSRTFEIPACGVFMLAEKSKVHQSLFEVGKEAEFFTEREELLEKVKYYLQHEDERKAIAKAGLARSKESGYSHEGRLTEVIRQISSL